MKIALGFLIAFAIGALCRITGVPLPAPPILIGSLLVVEISVGYIATDRIANRRAAQQHVARNELPGQLPPHGGGTP